ncbi:hypothetical protein SBBP1_1210001 [Burkholderiales bacterium]|nr:hypothetical protein SBBP1_1210001 [Burkholderiales bacterium]
MTLVFRAPIVSICTIIHAEQNRKTVKVAAEACVAPLELREKELQMTAQFAGRTPDAGAPPLAQAPERRSGPRCNARG